MICGKCGQTHDPKKCTGHVVKANGKPIPPRPCKNDPSPGCTVCWKHGAKAPQVRKAGAERVEAVRLRAEVARDLTRLGVAVDLADGDAIRAMRDEAAGNVIVLRRLIQQLDLSVTGMVYDPDTERFIPPSVDGIAVRTYHQSGIATGEAKVHVLVAMYNDERDRLAKLDEACVKLGLEERRVVVGEVQAAALVKVVTVVLDSPELALSREQRETGRQLAGKQLRELARKDNTDGSSKGIGLGHPSE